MSVTTWSTIRNDMIAYLETSTTPTTQPASLFRAHPAERNFLETVEANPASAFRLFAISDFEEEDSGAALNDQRLIDGVFAISVAYPEDYRYGTDADRDRGKVMQEDMYTIDDAIGLKGYTNVANVAVLEPQKTVLDLEGARVLEISYRAVFTRAS